VQWTGKMRIRSCILRVELYMQWNDWSRLLSVRCSPCAELLSQQPHVRLLLLARDTLSVSALRMLSMSRLHSSPALQHVMTGG
jgi:hypothetical protein